MKLTIITGRDGKIIGTARVSDGDDVAGRGGPVAGPDQSVHVIDLPSELEIVQSAEDLHQALERHLQSGRAN